MTEPRRGFTTFRREHPVFFWGVVTLVLLFTAATVAVALRIPDYEAEAAALNQRMTEAERATRDRLLESRARRSELAVALLKRELRIRALEEKGVHLAISLEDSTLSLRHGKMTLRAVPIQIGPDSVIRAPDGRTWRFVRALGERRVVEKEHAPTYTVPEWVYVGRDEPVPSEEERKVKGGLGRYVIRLDDGTEIYSEPKTGPLAGEVKPAAFMAGERDLLTIFDALRVDTPVFIY